MSATKKVLVTNIPVNAFVEGWVTVPADAEGDELQDAIGLALKTNGYTRAEPDFIDSASVCLDDSVIDGGWEFDIKK